MDHDSRIRRENERERRRVIARRRDPAGLSAVDSGDQKVLTVSRILADRYLVLPPKIGDQRIGHRRRHAHQARGLGSVAQRVHDLTVLRYEKGLATQLEASDARLALLQARTNLAQAISDYYVADAQMRKALGLSTAPER